MVPAWGVQPLSGCGAAGTVGRYRRCKAKKGNQPAKRKKTFPNFAWGTQPPMGCGAASILSGGSADATYRLKQPSLVSATSGCSASTHWMKLSSLHKIGMKFGGSKHS